MNIHPDPSYGSQVMAIDVPLGNTPHTHTEVLAILKFHTSLFSSDLAMFILATRFLGFSPLYNI